jgi:hypothetical protein
MKLYRGDNKNNINDNFFDLLYYQGIFTNLIKNGNPNYLEKNGFLKAINQHIKSTKEQFHKVSHFLSFTENENTAKKFARRNKNFELIECERLKASCFIIEFDINKLEKLDDGFYKFTYFCDYSNFTENEISKIEFKPGCNYCQNGRREHLIYFFKCSEFIKSFCIKDKDIFEKAIKNEEWLLLPYDYLIDLNGVSAMIPLSNIWKVIYYNQANDA